MTAPTMCIKEIAAAFGKTEAWFRDVRHKLMREHGFPAPLPGVKNRWSRALVEAWIANGGQTPKSAGDPIAAARAYLEARIGNGASIGRLQ